MSNPVVVTGPSPAEIQRQKQKSSLFHDVVTLQWLVRPLLAAQIALVFILGYMLCALVLPSEWNPFRPFLFLSYKIPTSEVVKRLAQNPLYGPISLQSEDNAVLTSIRMFFQGIHTWLFPNEPALLRYGKGWLDLCFMAYYVIVFSILRQVITEKIYKPLAGRWGIRSVNKQVRFAEQGYALTYWGSMSIFGLYVMSFQDSWWYQLDHLWYQYPHWQMRPELKLYYLLQASYWLQQAFVMFAGLERPRKDYYELIAHHLVTLWLIGWSYFINLTMIGTTVFVCMDIPDTWLAVCIQGAHTQLSKMLNYLDLNLAAATVYSTFMVVWSYFRIYLSARTLYSVYKDYHLIPAYARTFYPSRGHWLVWWMQCHVFAPLFLLLLLNIFWYVIMWRVLYRAICGVYGDTREEGEDAEEKDK